MKKTYISPKAKQINIEGQQLQANSPGGIPANGNDTTNQVGAKRGNLNWFDDDADDYDY